MIQNINFFELESERYWSFPKTYTKERIQRETHQMIFSGDYAGGRKYDGHYFRFIKDMDGTAALQSRSRNVNGIFLNKLGHVPHLQSFFNLIPNGSCLLGELYFPKNEGSKNVTTIMGCLESNAISRQEKGEKLNYYIFDIWAWNGMSLLDKPAEDRFDFLMHGPITLAMEQSQNLYVQLAEYFEGEELWEEIQKILEEGGEGVVITRKNAKAEPGKKTARKTLKIKKELSDTVDCVLTGGYRKPNRLYTGKEIQTWDFWENIKTNDKVLGKLYKAYAAGEPIEPVTKPYFYGWAGSLEIGLLRGDKIVPIGFISGVSDEVKRGIVEESEKYKGRCCEVTAMEIDNESGSLRHAKLEQFRDDITIRDCTWEKVYGKE